MKALFTPPDRGRAVEVWTQVGLNSVILVALVFVEPRPAFGSPLIPSSSPTGFHSVIPA
jgi:hypothetical protein